MNKLPMVFIIQLNLQKQKILTDGLELAGIAPVYAYVSQLRSYKDRFTHSSWLKMSSQLRRVSAILYNSYIYNVHCIPIYITTCWTFLWKGRRQSLPPLLTFGLMPQSVNQLLRWKEKEEFFNNEIHSWLWQGFFISELSSLSRWS